jgi:hypothetical protein
MGRKRDHEQQQQQQQQRNLSDKHNNLSPRII